MDYILIKDDDLRTISKPSTAQCDLNLYIKYLLSEPLNTTCTGLSEVQESVSHDSVNRFLNREDFTPRDLFNSVFELIPNNGELVVSVDDTVLDKPYSNSHLSELINHYWSGKHKAVVKGINLVTLFCTDLCSGLKLPVNFRVVNPKDNKTKNDYFKDMVSEMIEWGLIPDWVTGDSWYSSLDNLKFLRKHKLNGLFGIENNRIFSEEKGSYTQAQKIELVDATGNIIYLKGFGLVRLFRQSCKNSVRHYIMIQSDVKNLDRLSSTDFDRVHSAHWNIEEYHRVLKQECHAEHFQTRITQAITNHIFCVIVAFVQLELKRRMGTIKNWYRHKRELLVPVVRQFMTNFGCLDSALQNLTPSVNA